MAIGIHFESDDDRSLNDIRAEKYRNGCLYCGPGPCVGECDLKSDYTTGAQNDLELVKTLTDAYNLIGKYLKKQEAHLLRERIKKLIKKYEN